MPKKTKENKKSNKKTNSTKSSKKNLIIFFIVLIIFLGILFFIPIFAVNNINVSNNKKVSTNQIIKDSGIVENENMFRVMESNIANNIKKNPYIKNVTVTKKLPSTIEIYVEERQIAFQIENDDKYLFIDGQGYILEESNFIDNGTLLIKNMTLNDDEKIPGKRLSDSNLSKLNDITNILNMSDEFYSDKDNTTTIKSIISEISIKDNEYILTSKSESKTIYIGNGDNLNVKMQNLQAILIHEKGNAGTIYLNMDFITKNPYFSPEL